MNQSRLLLLTAAALASAPALSSAMVFGDATTDIFDSAFNPNLDITSVNVTNSASTLTFNVQTVGSAADWTKFQILINTGSGPTTTGNAWGRNHSNPGGANFFVGSWIDSGGGVQLWSFDGSTWNDVSTGNVSLTINSFGDVTYDISLAALGNPSSISFDVGTTGGGPDPYVDVLSRSDLSTDGWGTQSVGGTLLVYAVPEPSSYVFLGGLLALCLVAWKRRR